MNNISTYFIFIHIVYNLDEKNIQKNMLFSVDSTDC